MNNYKVTAIENFTYTDFDKVIFIKKEKYNYNWIYKGDVFLCDKDRYEYLSGNNKKKLVVVELVETLEVEKVEYSNLEDKEPKEIETFVTNEVLKENKEIEEKPKKKRTTKKTSK